VNGLNNRNRLLIPLIAFMIFFAVTVAVRGVVADMATAADYSTPVTDFLSQIGSVIPPAFIIAFMHCMLGYIKQNPPQDFELVKFLTTLCLSMLVGWISVVTGWDYTQGLTWLANGNITIWMYWLIKIIAIKVGWVTVIEPPVG